MKELVLIFPNLSVLIDDTDTYDRVGGGGFAKFGIHAQGAVVVARPDGYIGMVSSLESAADDIRAYFAGFLRV
jgi:phenol 2-monooxygenase